MIIGYAFRPQTKDLKEQQRIYDEKCAQYEIDIAYYKELCKWHVDRWKNNEQYDRPN
jgi:hypothetical protein